MVVITKLEAAHRQLTTAICMYFDDDDLAAIHTLVCAAREIYEKHCAAQGIDRMFEQIVATNPERTAKQLWDILNGPRNFLKHPEASMDLSARLEIDDEMNACMLWIASYDCAMLCRAGQPPEVQAYTAWFMGTRFPRGPAEVQDASDGNYLLQALDTAYPGLHDTPPGEQKRIGKLMIKHAQDIAAGLNR